MISIITPQADWPQGWDAADALAAGWTTAQAEALIKTAVPFDRKSGAEGSAPKKGTQKSQLINISDGIEKWRDENGEAHVSFQNGSRTVHCLVRDRQFRNFLTFEFEEASGSVPGAQVVEDVLRSIEGRCSRGPVYETFRRVAYVQGCIYLDLCDQLGRAVQVTQAGWSIVTNPSVKFLRNGSMKSLPEPEGGVLIEELRAFIHGDDEIFTLIVAWLMGCLMHRGPFPVLAISGEQGSGKSFVSRLLRALLDPSVVPTRSMPKEERDLLVSANNSWIMGFDNLSNMPNWFSDALCRISTGSGFGTRRLQTDGEETIFAAARAVLMNGISDLADRPDLADRSISIHLPRILETERRPEREVWRDFEKARPGILGALLDAASTGLRRFDLVKLAKHPRLADFAHWVEACAPALGWEPGQFIAVYAANKESINETALEADPVAMAIVAMILADSEGVFEGSPSALYGRLNEVTPEAQRKSKYWPTGPSSMGSRLRRVAPLLRSAGLEVESRKSGTRTIRIVNTARHGG